MRVHQLVGKTPLVEMPLVEFDIDLYGKLELNNPTGSVKDRSAHYMLESLLSKEVINKKTKVVESSSGNFAISLSAFSKYLGIDFTAVIDPIINPMNEFLIKSHGGNIVKVDEVDVNGGYLLTRIAKVKEIISEENAYWTNQYSNKLNAEAYKKTLGKEILEELDLDYIFLGVSSGGTIAGVSQAMKSFNAKIKVIAVDIVGSVIFGGLPKKRYIPGIGAGMRGSIIDDAIIDEVIVVDERDSITGCKDLVSEQNIFAGGSSGTVYFAIKEYFKNHSLNYKPKVAMIICDKGERYFDTIYNREWVLEKFGEKNVLHR